MEKLHLEKLVEEVETFNAQVTGQYRINTETIKEQIQKNEVDSEYLFGFVNLFETIKKRLNYGQSNPEPTTSPDELFINEPTPKPKRGRKPKNQ